VETLDLISGPCAGQTIDRPDGELDAIAITTIYGLAVYEVIGSIALFAEMRPHPSVGFLGWPSQPA
jgi:hypothetical protein